MKPNIATLVFLDDNHFRSHLCVSSFTHELPDSIKIAINWERIFVSYKAK